MVASPSLVKICLWNQQLVFCLHSVETKKGLEGIILKDRFFFSIVILELGRGKDAYLPRSGEKGQGGQGQEQLGVRE